MIISSPAGEIYSKNKEQMQHRQRDPGTRSSGAGQNHPGRKKYEGFQGNEQKNGLNGTRMRREGKFTGAMTRPGSSRPRSPAADRNQGAADRNQSLTADTAQGSWRDLKTDPLRRTGRGAPDRVMRSRSGSSTS